MSVQPDTRTRQKRMAVKGLMNAPASLCGSDFFFCRVTAFLPKARRLADTSSSERPRGVLLWRLSTSIAGCVAAYRMRPFRSLRSAFFSAVRFLFRMPPEFLFIVLPPVLLRGSKNPVHGKNGKLRFTMNRMSCIRGAINHHRGPSTSPPFRFAAEPRHARLRTHFKKQCLKFTSEQHMGQLVRRPLFRCVLRPVRREQDMPSCAGQSSRS